ncbi:SCP2 sterol-binding domain-containing protein (plasmid) [Chromobacterium amazonense]|uniref:ubiquinone anaerobic biosynthesis accessory factor UbiT n=1 Tax=Chromobacterium amazonense TaxID=1382803 RepID=UPI00237DA5C5|nr:SCP2 sterol-binding domain-containing protein [Chromobacterium amazonense]MDE1713247.1 SCP2 sterol-binding domain-containing protein [Chromobacterium amazonense]
MRIPELTLPSAVGGLLSRLPATPPSQLLAATLNQLAKRGVLPVDMALLAGKRFEIRLEDAGLALTLAASDSRFSAAHGPADLILAANCADFARMLLREEDPDTLFFNRKLRIEGDTELGLIVKNLLDSIDWSETPLSRLMSA